MCCKLSFCSNSNARHTSKPTCAVSHHSCVVTPQAVFRPTSHQQQQSGEGGGSDSDGADHSLNPEDDSDDSEPQLDSDVDPDPDSAAAAAAAEAKRQRGGSKAAAAAAAGSRQQGGGSDSDSEEGGDLDPDRVLMYERSKLRWFYAVVMCDSVATAAALYASCDGVEFERSASKFDLRWVLVAESSSS